MRSVPAEQVYWLLEPDGHRSGADPSIAMERVVPQPAEDLQVVWVDLPDQGRLYAALPRETVAQILAAEPDLDALQPAAPPPEVDVPAASLEQLNLLQGTFEPTRRRRQRRHASVILLTCMGIATGLLLVGAWRRTTRADHRVLDRQRAVLAAATQVGLAEPDPDRCLAALVSEARRLESQQATTTARPAVTVEQLLQAVWQAWPQDQALRVSQVRAAADGLTITGHAPGAQAVAGLPQMLRLQIDGVAYTAKPVEIQAQTDGITFTIVLHRR